MVPAKIEISSRTIIFTVVFLLSLKFLWIIKDLIFSLFIALIIVSALKPAVAFLEKKRVPRLLSSIVVYFLFLFCVGNAVGLIIPPLVNEITHLVKNLPSIMSSITPYFSPLFNMDVLNQYIPDITNKTFSIIKDIFSNALFIISTLFFGFYLLLEEDALKRILLKFYREDEVKSVFSIIDKAERRLSAWFWGEITLMVVIGVMTFIGLNLIGMRYALALAVFAGFLEAIPNIGPITSVVPAALIGFSQSYFLGFANIALYFIIQQLENHLIVPLVMRKAVGLHPIVTLIALIIGGKLAGVLGILLSVPMTLVIETVLIEAVRSKRA
jgi:predicted PurR-regulated permease PerM